MINNTINPGDFHLTAFDPEQHTTLLHDWVTKPYAAFWGMQCFTQQQVKEAQQALLANEHTNIFLGFYQGKPAFMLETYNPASDIIADFYDVLAGDRGMHLLLAPADNPISGFSSAVFRYITDYLFSNPAVERIVVEPDARNEKIHRLNKRFGFFHQQALDLPHKRAYLATCTRPQFTAALSRLEQQARVTDEPAPEQACAAITPDIWLRVNRKLVCKAIAEFTHERLLSPEPVQTGSPWQQYRLNADSGNRHYIFAAQCMALNHWYVDADSIECHAGEQPLPVDAIEFILDFQQSLGIGSDKLPVYLEEITSTLNSGAFKHHTPHLSAQQLASADFQQIETSMTEGHPCFVANNGRIGFDTEDFRRYAPEAASPVTLLWLAAHKSRAHFASTPDIHYQQLIDSELDISTRERFIRVLTDKGLTPDDYVWIPVHPWQWFHKLVPIYSPEIASQHLVCLGFGDDAYLAQQSIRTFFNISQPGKFYVKTALSILNMGFMRGLSALYMRSTPAINQWLYDLIANDSYLQSKQFTALRECASVGYEIPYYAKERIGDTPYRKMLAALWRENPTTHVKEGQQLMTMAALLHTDPEGNALLPELIKQSGLSITHWLQRYFDVYLSPLLHCFYQHKLAFMPHGENLILALDHHTPVKAFMKDIGEEIVLQNSNQTLPGAVQRIAISVPEEMEVLAIFTDVFDCFFRFMAQILYQHANYPETLFWRGVAQCVINYQQANPQLADAFKRHDLFAPHFALSCLNRLQLRNNQQMVDLTDPAGSLSFHGTLENPIAAYHPATLLTC